MESTIRNILKCIRPKYLGVMIENGWLMIESTFYALRHPPVEYYEKLGLEEAQKVERARVMGEKFGMPALGVLRMVASYFPYKDVEEKVTPEWMMTRGREKFPELIKVIEEKKEAGQKWLERQCTEVVKFATGRLVWDSSQDTFVEAKPRVRR